MLCVQSSQDMLKSSPNQDFLPRHFKSITQIYGQELCCIKYQPSPLVAVAVSCGQ